jgi:hypothetical protein
MMTSPIETADLEMFDAVKDEDLLELDTATEVQDSISR